MSALVSQADFNGDTPLIELQRMIIDGGGLVADDDLRKKMFVTLVSASGGDTMADASAVDNNNA